MTRLNATTPRDFKFQHNDLNATRAQKLEMMRRWVIEQIETALTDDPEPEPTPDGTTIERVRSWWKDAPAANQTLIIWPFAENMTLPANLEGSIGFLGGILVAPVAIEIYRNPTFTGAEITGGDLVGTMTIDNVDNSFTFATVDAQDFFFEPNDVVAAKWPNVTEAGAHGGAFMLAALFGHIATFGLLLEGDQQSGEDLLLLEGDQSDGDDLLLLEGGA